jgi:TolB-like protein
VGQVRSHKRGAIISLALLLVVGAIAVVYGWRLKQAPASTEKEIKSLAVMPLESVNPDENHLGLGIADAVILRISQTGKLVVRPTSAGRRYLSEDTDGLTAAKQLGVDSVLEGTVQRANNRLRVNVNLLRTSDGISLWSDSFNLNAGDIFAIQDTISQQVASRLQLKLDAEQQARLGKRYTNNQAYEYYVKGRTNLERLTIAIGDREAIDAAIINFKKAVELDSKYALAYAQWVMPTCGWQTLPIRITMFGWD